DRATGAFSGAFVALVTEILQAKIDWLIRFQWHVRCHHHRFKALLEMALTRANALAELPQANYAKMKTLMRQDAIEQIRQSMA
ncbi:hypothetical protein C2W62_54085, partial [Candidatus Entotheonella serta]